MDNLLPFIIKSSIVLAVFYLYFHLFLKKTKQFQLNRLYLISSSILAVVIPFLSFSSVQVKEDVSVMSVMLKEVSVVANYSISKESTGAAYLNYIYIIGLVLFLFLFVIKFISLYDVIRKNKAVNKGIYKLVELSDPFMAYSFFKYVFVSKESKEDDKILSHELVHVKQNHSVDVLIINLLQGILWFNPIIYLYKKAIEDNHEYIADNEVIKCHSASGYLQLLINQRMGTSVVLTNSFAQSNLKKRIGMMKKQNNMKYAFIKYMSAFALPVMMVFAMSACNSSSDKKEDKENLPILNDIKKITVNKDKTVVIETKDGVKHAVDAKAVNNVSVDKIKTEDDDPVFVRVEKMPSFKGGQKAMYKYLASKMKYPVEAMKANVQGKVYVGFVVGRNGEITNVKVLRSVDTYLDAEALRVVSNMPEWTPGLQGGKAVRVSYTVPVNFKMK